MLKIVVKTIGTPFNKPLKDQLNGFEIIDLYNFAKNNKIGLLFLESLPENILVGEIREELEKQREYHRNLKQTAIRIATLLNTVGCKYAIIKSHFPFPAVPADVDLIVFGDNAEYNKIVNIVSNNAFEKLGEAPLELLFHDTSRGVQHGDPASKDAFDVDVYKEIGAGRIIYIDKRKIIDQISHNSIDGQKMLMLKPSGEIAVSIFHSIFPERIFTLLLYYQITYAIMNMPQKQINEFIRICANHKLKMAGRIVLSLCETVHEICFEEPLNKLVELRKELGGKVQIIPDKLPYNYPTRLILDAFWSKRNDPVFAISFFKQIISMINPKYAKYVVSVHKDRKDRDTY
jgi:hypothetical protein